MKKKIVLTFALLSIHLFSFSQNDADIVKFSKLYHGGSARFEALGGAFGALGADISAVQINPASMGRYSSSQIGVTLRPSLHQANADFMGTTSKEIKTNFAFPSMGIVFTNDISERNKGGIYSQFAIGVNNITHYNHNTTIAGEQYPSQLENFMDQAKGVDPANLSQNFPFTTSLAWESYSIEHDPSNQSYYAYLTSGDMKMRREINSKFRVREYYFSYSQNRMNKLYYGFALNYKYVESEENYTHAESLTIPDTISVMGFKGFDYKYNLKTTGGALNLKLGAVYLITDAFRVGLAYHTGSRLHLKDTWTADMIGRFNSGDIYINEDLLPKGEFSYRLRHPSKTVLSAAYIFGLNGLISADIEYIAYNNGKLMHAVGEKNKYDFSMENEEAKKRLTNAFNYRIGAEYAIQQKYFIRAGFSLYGNAYKTTEKVELKPDVSYSGGIGYKINDQYVIDIAFVNRVLNRNYYPFVGSNIASTKLISNFLVVTGIINID